MAITITCDKCCKEIAGGFVIVRSSFYSTDEADPIEFCAPGDEFVLCDKCYDEFVKAVN